MKYQEYVRKPIPKRAPAQIEADLDDIRSEMQSTLRALEARVTPRVVLDQTRQRLSRATTTLATYLGDRLRRLVDLARERPLPAALLTVGLSTFFFVQRRQRRRLRIEAYTAPYAETRRDSREAARYRRRVMARRETGGHPVAQLAGATALAMRRRSRKRAQRAKLSRRLTRTALWLGVGFAVGARWGGRRGGGEVPAQTRG